MCKYSKEEMREMDVLSKRNNKDNAREKELLLNATKYIIQEDWKGAYKNEQELSDLYNSKYNDLKNKMNAMKRDGIKMRYFTEKDIKIIIEALTLARDEFKRIGFEGETEQHDEYILKYLDCDSLLYDITK